MSFWPVPDIMKNNIYELTPRMFTNRSIRLVLLDVDNTLAPYTTDEPDPRLVPWVRQLKSAGIDVFILSNNRGSRPEAFARTLGIGFAGRAWKPFTRVARQVLDEKGCPPANAAVIGDQIYTDTACAKWLGAWAVLVHPICFSNVLLRIRYYLEWPFRLKYKWREMK